MARTCIVLAMDYILAMLYFVLSAGNILYFSPQIQKTILTQTPLAGEMALVCQKRKGWEKQLQMIILSSMKFFICRASKSGAADSWPSSDDDEELDLSPKVFLSSSE